MSQEPLDEIRTTVQSLVDKYEEEYTPQLQYVEDSLSHVAGGALGGLGGTGAGVGGSLALIGASGSVVGLSGAGITSGLAAIGGTMAGGIAVVSCGTALLAGLGVWGGYSLAKKLWN